MSVEFSANLLFKSPPSADVVTKIENGMCSWLMGSALCEADEYDLIKDGQYFNDWENIYIPMRDPDLPPVIDPLLFGVSLNHLRYSMDIFNLEVIGDDRYSKINLVHLRGLLLWLIEQEEIEAVYYSSENSWATPLKPSDLKLKPENK